MKEILLHPMTVIIAAYVYIVWLESRRIEAEVTYLIAKALNLVVLTIYIGFCVFVKKPFDFPFAILWIVFLTFSFVLEKLREPKQELYKVVRSIGWLGLAYLPWDLTGDFNYSVVVLGIYLGSYNILLNVFRGQKWNYAGQKSEFWYNKIFYDITRMTPMLIMWLLVMSLMIFTGAKNINFKKRWK